MTIWITGYAAVTAIGQSAAQTFDSLRAQKDGLAPLRGFNATDFDDRHAYQVADGKQDVRPEPRRSTRMVVETIREACRSAEVEPQDVPMVIGTGLGEIRTLEDAACQGQRPPADELDLGAGVAALLGTDDVTTIVNACSASLHALAVAADRLLLGEETAIVVAGVDGLTASMHGLLDRVQPVSPDRLRPFENRPKGVIMGEGAAALVLSTIGPVPDEAVELLAVSMNCDAGHVTMPDPVGMAEAIRAAHSSAGIAPEQVDLTMLHGTGTPQNDASEGEAMLQVFGDAVGSPVALAIKAYTGHTSGASGLVAVAMAIEAMKHGVIPPNQPVQERVPEASDMCMPYREIERDVRLAQINAFGFGGVNSVALIREGQNV